jgi:hypothetical protein
VSSLANRRNSWKAADREGASERGRIVFHFICVVAPILATVIVLRFRVREAYLTAQGQASAEHKEELKGVLAVHLGEAAEIANRLHRFLPDIDVTARPQAEESIRKLVSHLDTLTVTLRDPGPASD